MKILARLFPIAQALLKIADIAVFVCFYLITLMIMFFQGGTNFDVRFFWSSPLVWMVFVLFPAMVFLQKRNRAIRNDELPGFFRFALGLLFFQIRAFLLHLHLLLLRTNARLDGMEAGMSLFSIALWLFLYSLLCWFGYGRIMRPGPEEQFDGERVHRKGVDPLPDGKNEKH